MKEKEIHEKAIRLLEGGIVDVDGHNVKLGKCASNEEACDLCEMDCLCHFGSEKWEVCTECNVISNRSCYLILTHSG